MTIGELTQQIMLATQPHYKDLIAQKRTCDMLLCGDPEREVHRVATTFIVTVDVLREAIKQGVDLIISHEPLMCIGAGFMQRQLNEIDEQKRTMIEESGIAVMRFHDGMHAMRPDLIYRGWMADLGWEAYNQPGPNNHFFIIPETTLGEVVELVKSRLNMNGIRTFGDPAQKVSRVGVLVGGGGQGLGNPMMPINFLLEEKLDLLIAGEIMELMLPYAVADAAALLDRPVSLMVAGHNRTEECGMKHLPSWLEKNFAGPEYCFIESGDPLRIL